MREVKRYIGEPGGTHVAAIYAEGFRFQWCKSSDVAALEAENKKLLKDAREFVAGLEAENARLREERTELSNDIEECHKLIDRWLDIGDDGTRSMDSLVTRMKALTLHEEKARRIYYQDIVYAVCNTLDRINRSNGIKGDRPGDGTSRIICGTINTPSTMVQDLMRVVERRLDAYRLAALAYDAAKQQPADNIQRGTTDLIPGCTGIGVALRQGKTRFVLQFDSQKSIDGTLAATADGLPVWLEVSDTRKNN